MSMANRVRNVYIYIVESKIFYLIRESNDVFSKNSSYSLIVHTIIKRTWKQCTVVSSLLETIGLSIYPMQPKWDANPERKIQSKTPYPLLYPTSPKRLAVLHHII